MGVFATAIEGRKKEGTLLRAKTNLLIMFSACTGRGGPNQEWQLRQGTIKDFFGFNAGEDCKVLHEAMKGIGTNEDKIINIVGLRSNQQRQELKVQYAQMWGKDLIEALKSELGGQFEEAILALFRKSDEFDAWCLHDAMRGVGTNENTLIEILCSRNNAELKHISETYKRLYQKDLAEEIKSETSGNFKTLLFAVAQAKRPEGGGNPLAIWNWLSARKDAQALYRAGEKTLGTDESAFHTVLGTRSFEHLELVFRQYESISKKTLEEAIKSELSGALESGMLAIVRAAQDRVGFFAECLYESMKGVGTDNKTLIRLIVSRSEIDLVQIKSAFKSKYKKSLESFIESDISGDYKKLMLTIVRGN